MSIQTGTDVLTEFLGRPVRELEAEFQTTVGEVQKIQAQLGDKDRRHPDGSRYTSHEYHEWRGRASAALRHLLVRQRALKDALKTARRRYNSDTPVGPDLKTPEALIHAAFVVIHRLACEGVELDPEEQRVKDALDEYLRDHGRVGA